MPWLSVLFPYVIISAALLRLWNHWITRSVDLCPIFLWTHWTAVRKCATFRRCSSHLIRKHLCPPRNYVVMLSNNWKYCIDKKFSQFLENPSQSAEKFPFKQLTFLEYFHFGEKYRNFEETILKIMHFTSLVKHLFWLTFLISGHWFCSSLTQDISRQRYSGYDRSRNDDQHYDPSELRHSTTQ